MNYFRAILGTMASATLLLASPLGADDLSELVNASRAATKTFGANLKGELQKAMASGGPANGIAVCHDKALQIAAATSQETGLRLSRTSLKVRNPDNAPDDWELGVLQQFETRKARGETPAGLEYYEVMEENGGKTFRYMEAIATDQLCLACHGEAIAPALSAKIYELYPQDAARGFKVGDLRGAFSISRAL
jgi:hypothetical protein